MGRIFRDHGKQRGNDKLSRRGCGSGLGGRGLFSVACSYLVVQVISHVGGNLPSV